MKRDGHLFICRLKKKPPLIKFKDRWNFIALENMNQIYAMLLTDESNQQMRRIYFSVIS
jgi:hypothetical protein